MPVLTISKEQKEFNRVIHTLLELNKIIKLYGTNFIVLKGGYIAIEGVKKSDRRFIKLADIDILAPFENFYFACGDLVALNKEFKKSKSSSSFSYSEEKGSMMFNVYSSEGISIYETPMISSNILVNERVVNIYDAFIPDMNLETIYKTYYSRFKPIPEKVNDALYDKKLTYLIMNSIHKDWVEIYFNIGLFPYYKKIDNIEYTMISETKNDDKSILCKLLFREIASNTIIPLEVISMVAFIS